jgi:Glyoxalase-like domain
LAGTKSARLAALGDRPETGPDVIVDGPHLEICIQKVDVEPRSKTPLHFDIESADWVAEVERLPRLGATVKEQFEAHAWIRDPEGNDFCVVAGDR